MINQGNVADNYNLTVSDNTGWGPTLSDNSLTIPAGENRDATLTVVIPENALFGTDDNITVTAASIADNEVSGTDSCIAHATSSEVKFSLVTLYKIGLDAKLYLENGSKLVVKLYTYDDAFENENVIESFAPPAHVEENENARNFDKDGKKVGVKKAKLDLTTDNTENIISTIATRATHRSDLIKRISGIKGR